jgi:hypothetical protein
MITLKLTSFNGNTKVISVNTRRDAHEYISALAKSLPKATSLHVSCDALGISGHLKGNK